MGVFGGYLTISGVGPLFVHMIEHLLLAHDCITVIALLVAVVIRTPLRGHAGRAEASHPVLWAALPLHPADS